MAEFQSLPVFGREVPATEVSEIVVNGKRAILGLYDDRQRQASTMVLIIEGDETNGYLIATIPDAARARISLDDIRTALLTAIESPVALQDQMAGFPFSIDDMGDFRIAARVAGMSLILTDGPMDDMDKASGQSFVTIAAVGTGANSVDLARDLDAMTARFTQEHPGARFEKGRILTTARGEVAELAYERELPDGSLVAGVIWARLMGDHVVLVSCQYPPGDDEAFRRLESLRDGLRESEQ